MSLRSACAPRGTPANLRQLEVDAVLPEIALPLGDPQRGRARADEREAHLDFGRLCLARGREERDDDKHGERAASVHEGLNLIPPNGADPP